MPVWDRIGTICKAIPLPLRQQRSCCHGPSGRMHQDKKNKRYITPALFRKAMRCPAAIVGLPVLLLTRIPEKERMERRKREGGALRKRQRKRCILMGSAPPPRLPLPLGPPPPPPSAAKGTTLPTLVSRRKVSTARVAFSEERLIRGVLGRLSTGLADARPQCFRLRGPSLA